MGSHSVAKKLATPTLLGVQDVCSNCQTVWGSGNQPQGITVPIDVLPVDRTVRRIFASVSLRLVVESFPVFP